MTREEAIKKYGNPVEQHQEAMLATARMMEALHNALYTEVISWLSGPTENAQQMIAILLEKRAAYGLSNDPIPELQEQWENLPSEAELGAEEQTEGTNVRIHGQVDDRNIQQVMEAIRLALGGTAKLSPKGPIIVPLDPDTTLN